MKQNLIIILLGLLVLLQLISIKHSHDNSYRLSSIIKHSSNIQRLLTGNETKIILKKKN